MVVCSLDDCDKDRSKGWGGLCAMHAQRLKRHGRVYGAFNRCGSERKTTASATHTPTTADLYWAAGFIEGEGSVARIGRKTFGSVTVSACQVEREPLERLLGMFGGIIDKRKPRGFKTNKLQHVWRVSGSRARGVAMTLYPLLSQRRQGQIRTAFGTEERAIAA